LSGAIIATVAMAIAATTVAFAVVNGVLLQPLPYREPERLAAVWERNLSRQSVRNVVSPANFVAWREELRSLDRLAALMEVSAAVTGDGEPEQVGAIQASAAYFTIVGAAPLVGRLYTEDEDVEGGPRVAVLSEGYWRRRFGADPGIVGKSITFNGNPVEVVGVLPSRFDFVLRFRMGSTGQRDVWIPPQFGARARTFGGRYLQVIGRLAPGATLERAQHEASALAVRLRLLFPERMEQLDVRVIPLHEEVVGDVRGIVLVVFGAVLCVLLVACSNVASLLLTRASERQSEMAVRAALGAGRGRLVRQLLVESALLAGIGGAAGLVLAGWGLEILVASAPDLPRLTTIGLDPVVIGFALAVTGLTALLFGLAPAIQTSGRQLAGWLTQRSASGRRQANRARRLLVGAQLALSFVLLMGAGLLIRSLVTRLGIDLGFSLDGLLTAELSLIGTRDPATRAERFEQLVERVAVIPGLESVSAASIVPLSSEGQNTAIEIVDRPVPPIGQEPAADVRFVHRDYLRTLSIRLIAGRSLGPDDRADAPVRVLINESGARLHWPGESAVGKRIRMEWGDTLDAEVVGVVGDVRLGGPDDRPLTPTTLYWDHRQAGMPFKMALVMRTGVPAETIIPAVRAAVREIDPNLPLFNVRTMEDLLGLRVARARFATVALGIFAALALVLAALGLYGVMASATQQREREIGIRMALGADRSSVVGMVLWEGLTVVGPFLLVGAAGAIALSRLLRTLVYQVSPADPATLAGVALLLTASGFLACWLPARRASRVDPTVAIRVE
jgi:predicted permease